MNEKVNTGTDQSANSDLQGNANANMETSKPLNARRSFLVKASVGAAVASIPAKSVWATGLTNSIVASGHGSDFANGGAKLKSPGDWKSAGIDLNLKYKDIFGGAPSVGSDVANLVSSSALNHITLGALLGNNTQVKKFITDAGGTFIRNHQFSDRKKNAARFHVNGHDVYIEYYKVKNALKKPFGGLHNTNELIVSTYLNAKHSGNMGIHYPVVNGPRAPYGSLQQLAHTLHNARHHDNTGQMLQNIHAVSA